MIIVRAPLRVSFAGGGSDLREYYSRYGGSVLSVSIKKYIYLSMHPYFNSTEFFLKYSINEHVKDVSEIGHKIIKQIFSDYGIKGVDFNSSADIPSGTGLGSSSCFTAALTVLCNAYTGRYMNQEDIASYACEVEIDKLGEPIGKQDQYASAVGGLNFIKFNRDDTVSVEGILMQRDKFRQLEGSFLMFYLGSTRSASSILQEQKDNTTKNKKIENLHKMVKLSEDLKSELQKSNLESVGEILHQGWMYKKELAPQISNERVNHYYNLAMKNGAQGGKLLGAGGSGFLLFWVPVDSREKLRESLVDLQEFDISFDSDGAKVVYYNE